MLRTTQIRHLRFGEPTGVDYSDLAAECFKILPRLQYVDHEKAGGEFHRWYRGAQQPARVRFPEQSEPWLGDWEECQVVAEVKTRKANLLTRWMRRIFKI